MPFIFTASQLTAISNALGDTNFGLTNSEIDYLILECRFSDTSQGENKRTRIFNAFVEDQNARQDRVGILAFIRKSMKPERHLKDPSRFEALRVLLNQALSFVELAVNESGELISTEKASTISQAQRRADELRADMMLRKVHAEVLKYCREELLVSNYFHAVLEAVKSVFSRIRSLTGLSLDGGQLVDRAFGGDDPILRINALSDENEKSEQKGFMNLLKGTFGMFRNPTAHEAKVHWEMTKEDAEDLLSLVSMTHRRLDRVAGVDASI